MSKILAICFLLLVNISGLKAQEISIFVSDFNKDGKNDTITLTIESTSSYVFKTVILKSGDGRSISFKNSLGFSSFFEIVEIEDYLLEDHNYLFFKAIESVIFTDSLQKIDPSLDWLLQCYSSKRELDDTLFDYSLNFVPKWTSGDIAIPPLYHSQYSKKELEALFGSVEWINKINTKNVWLLYSGFNHRRSELKTTDYLNGKKLICSSHGVVIQNNNSNAWVFVSDGKVSDGHDKLRWPSIEDAKFLNDNKVIIVQKNVSVGNKSIFISDYVEGTCKKLSLPKEKTVTSIEVASQSFDIIFSDNSRMKVNSWP